MAKETVRIVMVGEVDHGKSTLIGRLLLETGSLSQEKTQELQRGMDLAFLTDQFKEERDEERTIDTTQVFFQMKKKRFCLIDTPGHREFIKNMMTGATQADAALIIIDAQAGFMEQAKRQVALLGLLGVRSIIVVVNKMDLVTYQRKRFLAIKNEVEAFFKIAGLVTCAVVPVCAKFGDNFQDSSKRLKWHKGPTLLESLYIFKARKYPGHKPLRLPIQDVYERGRDVIVVGRIASGNLRVGQRIVAMPQGIETRIVALMVSDCKKRTAREGDNVGLLLHDPTGLRRGVVISQDNQKPKPRTCFLAAVFWMDERPLGLHEKLRFRCATQDVECIIEDRVAKENFKGIGQVTIKTRVPVIVESFYFIEELGRFTLEINDKVCAVGTVKGAM